MTTMLSHLTASAVADAATHRSSKYSGRSPWALGRLRISQRLRSVCIRDSLSLSGSDALSLWPTTRGIALACR